LQWGTPLAVLPPRFNRLIARVSARLVTAARRSWHTRPSSSPPGYA